MSLNFNDQIMKKYISILVALTFIACETDVTDEITIDNSEPRLVLEGGIERNRTTPLSAQRIRLTTTKNFLDNTSITPVVTDAIVSVSDGTTTWFFEHTTDGIYQNTELIPQINTTYTLQIEWDGDTYVGEDFLTEVPRFDDFYFVFEEETLFTEEGYFIKFDTTDPVGAENYYYHKVFRNGEFIIVPDRGNNQTLIVSDEFFDGQQRIEVNPNEEVVFEIGDIATAQQQAISEAYFNYLYELFTQTAGGGLGLIGNPPPESIRGNIINSTNNKRRPLGFFYAVDTEEDTIEIVE